MQSTVERLAEAGHVGDALRQLRQLSGVSHDLRAVHAHLEALASNRELAIKLASEVASLSNSAPALVRALTVLGRLRYFSGRFQEGEHDFNRAREVAVAAGNAELEALALGDHIQSLLRFVGLEAAVGYLAHYRRTVIRAGRASSAGTLHRVFAEAELKAGRGHRALRELELSRLHVDDTNNQVSLAQLHFAMSAAVGLLGDVFGSFAHAQSAVDVARQCGATSILHSALVNVVHCQVMLGLHKEAAATFDILTRSDSPSIGRELVVRGNQLAMATALRDEALASAIDARFGPIAAEQSLINAQWYRLDALGFHLAFGRPGEAAAIGARCLAEPTEVDQHYLSRVEAATAEALAKADNHGAAALMLSQVVTGHTGALPEFLAATQRASAHLVAASTPAAAAEHFSRAARIYGHIGHMVGRAEALHGAATLRASMAAVGSDAAIIPHISSLYAPPSPVFGRVDLPSDATPATTPDAIASSVRAAAAMVDLTSRPVLSGYELLTLVASSDAAVTAAMFARRGESVEVVAWTGSDAPSRELRAASDEHVTFELGSDRERDVTVVVRPRNQQSARTTLLALQRLVGHGLTLHRAAVAESEKSALWPEPLPEQQLGFVCTSESMLELLAVTRRVASSNITILITGETGTGKELLAHAVHNCSPRAKQRFTPFNCTAVSRDMLDSQLFGYRKGAFTGAVDAFPGVIRGAAGGTLFLDEIGEIGLEVQPKLLRFLESSDVHPLGEAAPVKVDVRIVAATNANLDKMVADGRFREDLYYRLNVVKLTIPPLRERREEIPPLIDHFLERMQRETSKSGIRIEPTTAEYLLLYDWPGNVRELANEIRRVVAMAESGAVLMPEHLSPRIAASRRTVPAGQRPPTPSELLVRRDQPLSAAVEHVERALIMDALRVHGNVEDAARALGLSRKGLYLKRQRLKIDEV